MKTLREKVSELGYQLPSTSPPAANYVSTVRSGDLLFISGQIGNPGATTGGPIGIGLSAAEARLEAQAAALGLLAVIDGAIEGDVHRIEQIVRLGVFMAAAPNFRAHSEVGNGASDLLVAVLGERGRHVRTSVGVASLPAGAAVEVDAILRLRS